jgi:glucan phosphoethanolaminetransferase (alkaline phosphatase superfamily)
MTRNQKIGVSILLALFGIVLTGMSLLGYVFIFYLGDSSYVLYSFLTVDLILFGLFFATFYVLFVWKKCPKLIRILYVPILIGLSVGLFVLLINYRQAYCGDKGRDLGEGAREGIYITKFFWEKGYRNASDQEICKENGY